MRQLPVTKTHFHVEEWEATQSHLMPVFRELFRKPLRPSDTNLTGRPQGLV